jgi:hypothetical protein
MSQVRSAAPAVDQPARRPAAARGGGRVWWELAVLAPLAIALVARRPAYLLSHSFWVDEGWVADSVRAPLHQLPLLTSSTPLGWTVLLRLVPPVGGPQYLRLLPLAFGVASVLPAWWLGRRLDRRFGCTPPLHGMAAALAAALVPAGIARHDLKQYTAEAFMALLLLAAAARLEAAWSRGWLLLFAAACTLAFPFSNTAPFVAAGLLGGLAVASLARRAWRRLGELAAAAAAVGLAYAAFYTQVASSGDNAVVRAYWSAHYIPTDQGLLAAARFVGERLQTALGGLGLGPWPVAAGLLGLGLLALHRAGLTGVAVAAPLTAGLLVVAGSLHRYPFLHPRTGLFVTTTWMVLAAVGLAWLALAAARAWRPSAALAVAAAVAVALALGPAVTRAAARPLPDEDVHGIVGYLLAHRQAGDAIIASHLDAYPFAWYWPDRPVFIRTRAPTAIAFQVTYPPGGVIVARWSDTAAIDQALGRVPPGTRRVWLVAPHLTAGQRARWLARLDRLGAAVDTPMHGLFLARLRAGPP